MYRLKVTKLIIQLDTEYASPILILLTKVLFKVRFLGFGYGVKKCFRANGQILIGSHCLIRLKYVVAFATSSICLWRLQLLNPRWKKPISMTQHFLPRQLSLFLSSISEMPRCSWYPSWKPTKDIKVTDWNVKSHFLIKRMRKQLWKMNGLLFLLFDTDAIRICCF